MSVTSFMRSSTMSQQRSRKRTGILFRPFVNYLVQRSVYHQGGQFLYFLLMEGHRKFQLSSSVTSSLQNPFLKSNIENRKVGILLGATTIKDTIRSSTRPNSSVECFWTVVFVFSFTDGNCVLSTVRQNDKSRIVR